MFDIPFLVRQDPEPLRRPHHTLSSNATVHTTAMQTLSTWVLSELDFGTHREDFGKIGRLLRCPKGIPDDKYYKALHLVNRYGSHARSHEHQHVDPLDELPLEFTFYLALAKVMHWSVEPDAPVAPDFTIFGFPNPLINPSVCLYHSFSPGTQNGEATEEVFPETDLPCSHGMEDLFSWFEDIVDREIEPIDGASFEHFKTLITSERVIARACTKRLMGLDLGSMNGLLRIPGAAIQTVQMPSAYTPWTYILTLYLLHRYRASSHFNPTTINDVPLELIFYATLYISGDLLNEECDLYVPEVFFTRLGFPLPVERQTDRVVCKFHAEEQRQKRLLSSGHVTTWPKNGEEIVVGPDPTTIGANAKQYMGCDEGVVCTRGMSRLKEYMLDRVFQWDVGFHRIEERPRLVEFVREMEFDIPTPVEV